MPVKMRIPHETKFPEVIQVPYSSTFVKITAVHMCITFTSKVFKIQRSKTWVRIRFNGTLDLHKYNYFLLTSSSCSAHEPIINPYPGPNESGLHAPTPCFQYPFLYYLTIYALIQQVLSLLQAFLPKSVCVPLFSMYITHIKI